MIMILIIVSYWKNSKTSVNKLSFSKIFNKIQINQWLSFLILIFFFAELYFPHSPNYYF